MPESYEKGKAFFPEIVKHLRYFEETLGPYPFRADKYGVAQTPHLGMEHQSIIAYGANFDNSAMTGKDWGFDALHHHELSHEWWGNMVTNQDWRDMWLHEGFGAYMQALYVEKTRGPEMYDSLMAAIRNFNNVYAVAPRASKTGNQIYKAPIYVKGAWVLHSLRYLIGDEAFFTALRRMAYPDPAMEKITDGRQCRFATTDDFLQIAEQVSGLKLDWFFEVYLRQPKLPQLIAGVQGNQLTLAWKTPDNLPFFMPIDIQIGEELLRVEISEARVVVELRAGEELQIDPHRRGLFSYEALETGKYYLDKDKYEKSRKAFENMLKIDPENIFALQMMKHISYAEKNREKLHSGFFEIYTGKYQVSPDYIQTVTMEDGKIFISRGRRSKLRIYPVSDNEFILPQFDLYYVFNKDSNGLVKELVAKSEDSIIKTRAKRVE
ncbi:MAG: M1 family aminopeptidase [Calditrichia bacterium]